MNLSKTASHNSRKLKVLAFVKSPTFRYQHTLILLLFVSATLIFLDLGVFSLSFIFGASLIFICLAKTPWLLKPTGSMWFLFTFLGIALLSLLFAETPITGGDIKIYIQSIYWFLLATVVYNFYPLINKQKLSKYVFWSVLILLTLFVIGFRKGMSQNAVAFSVIIIAPLGFYFLKRLWVKIAFAALLVFLILLNGSRSGAAISFGQSALLILFSVPAFKRYMKLSLLAFAFLIAFFTSESTLGIIGNAIYNYNPRLGELMTNTEFVLRNDMSWLQRKAQVQKGKQIFEKHPVLGIGYTKFSEYDIVIDESKIESDRGLRNIDNRSSHNSYINWLAETGLLGIGVMLGLFITILLTFWKNLNMLPNTFESSLFIAFVGMLIYFYTISAHLGTSTWIMYGIIAGGANALKLTQKEKKIKSFL